MQRINIGKMMKTDIFKNVRNVVWKDIRISETQFRYIMWANSVTEFNKYNKKHGYYGN